MSLHLKLDEVVDLARAQTDIVAERFRERLSSVTDADPVTENPGLTPRLRRHHGMLLLVQWA
jgi:hypothetical protein